jgi:hypothetical protein
MKKQLYTSYAVAITTVATLFVTSSPAHAVVALNPSGAVSGKGAAFSFATLAGNVITYLLFAAGFLAVLYLIYNGIQYITSAGNADKVKTARAGIINAVIGIAVIAAAYFIINFALNVGNTVGSDASTNSTSGISQ